MTKAPSKTEMRRAALRDRLIDHAEEIIARDGLAALKARDLAGLAGCSVGAIYTVFPDLNALVMAVNGRTFRRLGAAVSASLGAQDSAPQDSLICMSQAYLAFAAENTQAWRALFDLEMSVEQPVPAWYLAELAALFALIAAPLRRIFPDWSAPQIDLMTRALFSSVHGIVLLGLEKRISGVPVDRIAQMIAVVLANVTDRPAPE
ncbi:TetR/AcrR family transcriptional regulator [Pseudorhodobacter sp. MZDSW-24AT]|uniref:TetR/AcrR family transcriptional regulator n=1 Tax=Pseudorhodobacter sp. MZDSW-24AT TaxID=2052957 RepID=UPI000C1F137D|nr:TetR/AcrR family transcriptional regulator [Pseudorhodobacter sp. MZDSW-24AT]PJF11096.1 TetR/AcrR family transcriptional regulator [Pseudorhodobacter sp. MZDSW-24AT]